VNKDNAASSHSFFERCYEVVQRIPYGRVTTYGAIANYLGLGKSARVVGWAMNHSHDRDIPAHRVVNRVGLLSGKHHFGGTHVMKQLLESESHQFDGDQMINFKDVFWDPADD
jgi:methylated-DNA-protein-cysteine methyltransferase-like protein